MFTLLTCPAPTCAGSAHRLWPTHPACPWCGSRLVPAPRRDPDPDDLKPEATP